MKMMNSVRTSIFALSVGSFLLAGSAFAQQNNADELVGVNAHLDQVLNSKTAQPGEVITAKLDSSAKTAAGVTLPRGTELRGKIETAQASQNRSAAKVSIVFTQAELKDGKVVPVKAILLGAYPATGDQAIYDDPEMGPAPAHVSPKEQVDQEPGILNHVAMHSDMHGQDSATFTKNDGNFRLQAGTNLQLAIGPSQNSGQMNGAE